MSTLAPSNGTVTTVKTRRREDPTQGIAKTPRATRKCFVLPVTGLSFDAAVQDMVVSQGSPFPDELRAGLIPNDGLPLEVSRLDSLAKSSQQAIPPIDVVVDLRSFKVVNGRHRVSNAILKGWTYIKCTTMIHSPSEELAFRELWARTGCIDIRSNPTFKWVQSQLDAIPPPPLCEGKDEDEADDPNLEKECGVDCCVEHFACTYKQKCVSKSRHFHRSAVKSGYSKRKAEEKKEGRPKPAPKKTCRYCECKLDPRVCPNMFSHGHYKPKATHKGMSVKKVLALAEQEIKDDVRAELLRSHPNQPPEDAEGDLVQQTINQLSDLKTFATLVPVEEEKLVHDFKAKVADAATEVKQTADFEPLPPPAPMTPIARSDTEELKQASIDSNPVNPGYPVPAGDAATAVNQQPPPNPAIPLQPAAPPVPPAIAEPEAPLATHKVVIFSNEALKKGEKSFIECVSESWFSFLVDQSRVALRNEVDECRTPEWYFKTRESSEGLRWFWEGYSANRHDAHETFVDLITGRYSSAAYEPVFTDVVNDIISDEIFQGPDMLENGTLKKIHIARIRRLLKIHPLYDRIKYKRITLNNTVNHIHNQLLLQGLRDATHEAERVVTSSTKPYNVDFQLGVRSTTVLPRAPPSRLELWRLRAPIPIGTTRPSP